MTAWTPVELLLTGAARALWPVVQGINRTLPDRSFHPRWAPQPLLKSQERSRPPLGWPRRTDSLCPACVREARARILAGEQAIDTLIHENVGEIPATIVERDGHIVIEKTCPKHGTFTRHARDRPRVPPANRVPLPRARLHGGRRQSAQSRDVVDQIRPRRRADDRSDQPLQHDVRPVLHGREPGRVRPRARRSTRSSSCSTTRSAIKPRRQMSVQFSGGEPTISPIFLDAVRYAREVGYFSVQAATNGIRFAQEPDFARRLATPASASPICSSTASARRPTRIERSAICSTSSFARSRTCTGPDIDVCLVVTIVNTVNNDQVGPIVKFALRELRQDQLRVVPAGVVHRARRGHLRRGPARPALHALAPCEGPAPADGRHRAAARLVSAVGVQRVLGRHRPDAGVRVPTGDR